MVARNLKPAALVCYICSSKLFVALREIDNALNKTENSPDDSGDTASKKRGQQHDQTLFGIAKNKLVHTKTTKEDSTNARWYFF